MSDRSSGESSSDKRPMGKPTSYQQIRRIYLCRISDGFVKEGGVGNVSFSDANTVLGMINHTPYFKATFNRGT